MTNQVLSRDEALKAIRLPTYRNVVFESAALRFSASDISILVLDRGGDNLVVDKPAARLLASRVGIPGPYADKCPAPLLAANLNYWVRVKKLEGIQALVDGSRIAAFIRLGAMPILDGEQILATMEDAIGKIGEISYSNVSASLRNVSLAVVGRKSIDPRPGDTFQAGVTFDYSPTDVKAPSIAGFTLRLVCSNGMIGMEQIKMSRRHVPEDIWGWLGSQTAEMWQLAGLQFDHLVRAANLRLPDKSRGELVAHIYHDFGFPIQAREAITDRLLRHGADTLLDLIDHVTYVASNDVEMEPAQQSRLMRIAGLVIEHPAVCDRCLRML